MASQTTAKHPASARLWALSRASAGLKFATTFPLWVIFTIMIIPQGLDYAGKNGMPQSSDILSRVTWLYLLGFGGLMMARNAPKLKEYARWVNPFLLAFIGFAALSWLWSIEPGVTNRRVMRAATIIMVCFQFVLVAWEPRRFQITLRGVMTWVLLASLIFVAIAPDLAIHQSEQEELKGAWRGITMGKNILGSFASVTIILWLNAWLAKQAPPFKCIMGIALAATLLAGTRSATSVMATLFAACFMLLLLRSPGSLKRYMPYLVSTFAIIILIYSLAVLRIVPGMEIFLKPITAITGKDLTFTGRTAIWEILREQVAIHPWLGGGYGAYWVGATPTSPSFEMLTRLYFYPSEGHNGYLDIVNDLGMIGGIILLGYFGSYIKQSLQIMKFDRYQGGLYLTLLFRGFLADMSESHWFFSLSVDFVFMTLASASMARDLIQHQVEAQTSTGQQPRPAAAPAGGVRQPRLAGPLARRLSRR